MDSLKKIHHSLSNALRNDRTENGMSVSRRRLTNRHNYFDFQDRTIFVNLTHARFGSTISLQAKPLSCTGDRLYSVWTDSADIPLHP
jgi:hypothetical protein